MKNFIGIDLGTTNSAICSFDGENLRLYKSILQNDVTPSAIYFGKRGNKFVGEIAYDNAAKDKGNAALFFKRIMGSNNPFHFSGIDMALTPEECSAEILKVLFGYLPEDIRNDSETGTVVTVPAAFNQIQKDATMSAAQLAGIGKVALMQEPVAAVMSVMRQRKGDGVFLVYDLGGGTLDIAIAESISHRVTLLAHGGIAMCGGRDFDKTILNKIVIPWLLSNFNLPTDLVNALEYKNLLNMATWVAERAKISLSSHEEVLISDPEFDAMSYKDKSGKEIYLDIPLNRKAYNDLIAEQVADTIQAANETMNKAGLNSNKIERIVFIGGPTKYGPLREKVASELGISPSTDVNPMTAVAEGAAVFAESIDWSSHNRSRKSSRGSLSTGGALGISFNYIARTPDARAKIALKIDGDILPGAEFKIDNLDTGWDSGRIPLKNGAIVDVTLSKQGDNTFKIWVFDPSGGPISLENNKIIITRSAISIDGIPSSSSIGIEVNEKGRRELVKIVHEGDPLPHKGTITFLAGESLRAGSNNGLYFNVWEGEIESPVTDNLLVGQLTIKGNDFDEGVIRQGAELICEYEVLDSGCVVLNVSVPDIGIRKDRNFFSRHKDIIDPAGASKQIQKEAEAVQGRIESILSKIDSDKLERALDKLAHAESISQSVSDPETTKRANDDILDAKKLLAQARKEHLKEIRQMDLDHCVEFFGSHIREYARPTEISSFDNLSRTAQRCIDSNNNDFENHLDELRNKNFQILWRQDWFIIDRFKFFSESDHLFQDVHRFSELVTIGNEAIRADDIDKLRRVVAEMYSLRLDFYDDEEMLAVANILRGH